MEETKVSADELAKEFIELRDAKKKLDDIYEKKKSVFETRMREITDTLTVICEEQNASSIRTQHGTIIRSVTTDYSTTDWESMHKLVLKYEAPYLLWKRLNNAAMKEFLEAHPEEYPPGLRIDSKYTVTVRRPTNRT